MRGWPRSVPFSPTRGLLPTPAFAFDAHHELVFRGSVVKALGPSGEPGLVATDRHAPGDFLRAALPAGLLVRRCEEPRGSRALADQLPSPDALAGLPIGTWDDWPWSLLLLVPDAHRAAWATPSAIVWDFELSAEVDADRDR